MPKNRPGAPQKPSHTRPERKERSPPEPRAASASADKSRQHAPDPKNLAKKEKTREAFQKVFGRNMRAARLKAGLKQSDVAAKTGLTQQYLSLIEAGQQNITLKTMVLLAEVVDSDLLEMLKRALDDPDVG